jgi:hypothetical protein
MTLATGGYYSYANFGAAEICPKGWWCPALTSNESYSATNISPFRCAENRICPTGSAAEQTCLLWQITKRAKSIFDEEPQCIDCPTGHYGFNNTECIICP